MTPEAKKARTKGLHATRKWRDRLQAEIVAGERPWNSIPPTNRKRRAKRAEAGEVYGPFHRFISSRSCIAGPFGCVGEVAGHHLKSVGAGGKDADGEVPLCAGHHTELHTIGRAAFERRYVLDLDAWAHHLIRTYSEEVA